MDWQSFVDRHLAKVLKMAGLESTCVSRNAAAQIITAASIMAAEKKQFETLLFHHYLDLCQDSDISIRKNTLSNLKFLFQKIEPSEVERLFFSELITHLNDPSSTIRFIVMEDILMYHQLFSTQSLLNDFVPSLLKEFELGWKETDNWLLQNCAIAVNFLLGRNLLQEDFIPTINKFFDVLLMLI